MVAARGDLGVAARGDLGAEAEELSDHEQDLDPEAAIPGVCVCVCVCLCVCARVRAFLILCRALLTHNNVNGSVTSLLFVRCPFGRSSNIS